MTTPSPRTSRALALCRAIVAILAGLVPRDRRADWRAEWDGELWELARRAERVPVRYGNPRSAALQFTLGAFPHALHEWREGWTVELLLKDLRHAVRSVARNRGFALTATLLIAIGVGANTTVFTLLQAVLLRPPAGVVDADRIVQIGRGGSAEDFDSWSHARYTAIRDGQRVFSSVAAYASGDVVIGMADETELASAQVVSSNYFRFLGVSVAMGRDFTDDEDGPAGAHAVAVISDDLWSRRYARAADIVGKTIVVRGGPFAIIGVAPRGFMGGDLGSSRPDFWVPLSMHADIMGPGMPRLDNANVSWLWVSARLAPNVTIAQATAATRSLVAELERDVPADRRQGVMLAPGLGLRPDARAIAQRIFVVLLAVVGGLLLIACSNLAALLLARGAARRGEMAVRLAIGATRGRLVRQLVLETVAVSALGSVAAFGLTFWTAKAVTPLIPYDVSVSYAPDWRVLAYALAVGVATSVLFGLLPALRASRTDLITIIRADASGIASGDRGGLQRALAVSQFVLSFVLLASTGLLLRSVQKLNSIDPGFRTEDVLVGTLDLSAAATPGQTVGARLTHVIEQLSALPGVVGVARATAVPAAASMASRAMWRPDAFDASTTPPSVRYMAIDTAYLSLMGVRLVRGRAFTAADSGSAAPAIIVNATLARMLFGAVDPLDREIAYGTLEGPRTARIVGIAADTKNRSLRDPTGPMVYVPVTQEPKGRVLLHVRTTTPNAAFASRLTAAVRRATPGAPNVSFTTIRERLGQSLADVRLIARLGAVFSGLALFIRPTPGGEVDADLNWVATNAFSELPATYGWWNGQIPAWFTAISGIPMPVVILVVVILLIWLPFRNSETGRAVYAVGSNEAAAYMSGVKVDRAKLAAYTLGG
ncbi:MAG TPA: ABC transporter permease, partial [Gemmatimonadaceae bacterium]|nr:ABC transporter permease [Gemmatimonadaceae bacterium]